MVRFAVIVCVVPERFVIDAYIVVVGELSKFPPITKGEMICVVEMPVVTTSAITPLPGAGSSPTLLEASFALDVLSVYSLNQPVVERPTFIRA